MQFHMASSMVRAQGRKSEEPPTGAEPCLGPACPKIARSEATAMSQAPPISCQPATLMPLIRRITGFWHIRMESTMPLKRSMYWPYSSGLVE